jgi:proteasome lid subunit RPN8/RPN11
MQLLLTPKVVKRLQRELSRAGSREIGGLLLSEHVRDEIFRVIEITVQHTGGSHVGFMRYPQQHSEQLQSFFLRTGHDYTRFNYLGEWHSHPCFEPTPSTVDLHSMQAMVSDPAVGANFLVLMIVRLELNQGLEYSATVFREGLSPLSIPLQVEANDLIPRWRTAHKWIRKIFRM